MSSPQVGVQYDCQYCKARGVVVEVPERYPEESVVDWVNLVRAHVYRHHRHCSAQCASSVVDLKIPLPNENSYIGQAVRQ